ncbi:MAG: MlaD family protein [Leptospirales bacterium]|nr:MlaD family protein [Leptospirales bacterium]
MGRNKNELRVGLFLITPLAIMLIVITLKLGYSLVSSTMDIYLKIDSISSIKDGTSVIVKGYRIGRIVDIRPVFKPELHFLATMRVTKDIELFEGCSVIIRNQNILGDAVIEIRNAENQTLPIQNNDVLEGIELVSLNAIMQQAHDLLEGLGSTVSGINRMLVDSRSNINVLTTNLASSVGHINNILHDSQKDILEMLRSFRATAATMEEISVELKKHPIKFLLKGD